MSYIRGLTEFLWHYVYAYVCACAYTRVCVRTVSASCKTMHFNQTHELVSVVTYHIGQLLEATWQCTHSEIAETTIVLTPLHTGSHFNHVSLSIHKSPVNGIYSKCTMWGQLWNSYMEYMSICGTVCVGHIAHLVGAKLSSTLKLRGWGGWFDTVWFPWFVFVTIILILSEVPTCWYG